MKKITFLLLLAIIGLSVKAQTAYITGMDNTISVINVNTNTVATTITVGASNNGVSVSPDGSKVYVTDSTLNKVYVINTVTNAVSDTISVGATPYGASVSPDGSKVFTANYQGNTVSVITTATNTVTATIPVGTNPYGVCISPDGSKAYVTNFRSNSVSVINTSTNTVSATINVGRYPIGISASPDGSKVFVANNGAYSVSVINAVTNTVSGTILVGVEPCGVSFSPDGNKVFVTNSGESTLNVINTATNTVSDSINVGIHPIGVSVSPDGNNVYVANNGSNTVSVINTATNNVSATIPVSSAPYAFGNFISTYTQPIISVSIIASVNPLCTGASTILTASGATTYFWSSSLGTTNPVTVMPTANTTYTVTGTETGATGTASITINVVTPVVPNICMVTTDSTSDFNYNVVFWDKTPYTNVDSFIVYRKDVVSSSYLRIGAVSASALSEFTDTSFNIGGPNGGNPRYSSWFYKLAIRDTCGNIGDESPYHQSMFVQQSGSNFSWNAYGVESGQINPVTGYSFLRDDDNTGNWHVLVNTGGLSTTDPDYATYPNGNWRIDALGFDCAPTMRLTNTSSFLKSHSNTIKLVTVGIEQQSLNNEQIMIYPNPANEEIQLISEQPTVNSVEIYNLLGEKIYSTLITDNRSPASQAKRGEPITINISGFAKGVYFLKVENEKGVAMKKFVKE